MTTNELSDFVKDKRTLDRILSKPLVLSGENESSLTNPIFPPITVERAKVSNSPLDTAKTYSLQLSDEAEPPAYSDVPADGRRRRRGRG